MSMIHMYAACSGALIVFFSVQDVVILNKVDLVSPEGSGGSLDELEKEIHNINALASIIPTVRCQVDLSDILDCRAYDATVSSYILIINQSFLFCSY